MGHMADLFLFLPNRSAKSHIPTEGGRGGTRDQTQPNSHFLAERGSVTRGPDSAEHTIFMQKGGTELVFDHAAKKAVLLHAGGARARAAI